MTATATTATKKWSCHGLWPFIVLPRGCDWRGLWRSFFVAIVGYAVAVIVMVRGRHCIGSW